MAKEYRVELLDRKGNVIGTDTVTATTPVEAEILYTASKTQADLAGVVEIAFYQHVHTAAIEGS